VHSRLWRRAAGQGESMGGSLAGGLALARFTVEVGGRELSLVVPESVDQVVDMYIDQGREDLDPYWARPWHSALCMADELLERPELVRGKTVVDVGAGLGLGGIAAALAGAERVVLLDREPLALQCSLLSAMACGVRAVGDPTEHGPLVLLAEGDGGSAIAQLLAANAERLAAGDGVISLTASRLDWLQPEGLDALGRFDVAIACDVLYEDFSVAPVAALLPQLLPASAGDILLADPPNRTRANRERFLDLIKRDLPDVALLEAGRRSSFLDGRSNEVQMLLFRRTFGGISSTIGLR